MKSCQLQIKPILLHFNMKTSFQWCFFSLKHKNAMVAEPISSLSSIYLSGKLETRSSIAVHGPSYHSLLLPSSMNSHQTSCKPHKPLWPQAFFLFLGGHEFNHQPSPFLVISWGMQGHLWIAVVMSLTPISLHVIF